MGPVLGRQVAARLIDTVLAIDYQPITMTNHFTRMSDTHNRRYFHATSS